MAFLHAKLRISAPNYRIRALKGGFLRRSAFTELLHTVFYSCRLVFLSIPLIFDHHEAPGPGAPQPPTRRIPRQAHRRLNVDSLQLERLCLQ